jgi:prepilin-type N-terminal cleavage/methylation domain-containing protein
MHQLKALRTRWQAGDTIVEVMIVLAVLGLAISISYATANRSLLNARQAQENSIATELAQSQMEAIQAVGCSSDNPTCNSPTDPSDPTYQLFNQPAGGFCMDTSASPPEPLTLPNSACTVDGLYNIVVTYDKATVDGSMAIVGFNVVISWNDVLGQGKDTVTMDYFLPEGS